MQNTDKFISQYEDDKSNNQEEFNKVYLLEDSMHNVSEVIKILMDLHALDSYISHQDERDRHSIALWGTSSIILKYLSLIISYLSVFNIILSERDITDMYRHTKFNKD